MRQTIVGGVFGLIMGCAIAMNVSGQDLTQKHYLKIKPGLYETHVEVVVGGGYVASAEILTREFFDAFYIKKSGRLNVNGMDIGEVRLRYDPEVINSFAVRNETDN